MHAFKPFLAGSAFLLFAFAIPEIDPADAQQGTGKLTVVGVDGIKINSTNYTTFDFAKDGKVFYGDDFKPSTKGRVVMFYVRDAKGNVGTKVAHLPDGKQTPVTVQIMPAGDFEEIEEKAQKAKKKGDAAAQKEGYDQAKVALARDEQEIEQTRQAIDAWAKDNDIPTMTLAQVDKQIKVAEALGGNADKTRLDNLRVYRLNLNALSFMKLTAADRQKRLAAIEPPKISVTALPGAGTPKITVLGSDGKPVYGAEVSYRDMGAPDPLSGEFYIPGGKGMVMYYVAIKDGKKGNTTAYIPDGKETPVTIQLKPEVNFNTGEQKALKGKESGDAAMQQAGYDEAKEAVARADQQVAEMQTALDAWAKDHDVPTMTASEANKQIKASQALGANQDETKVANLRVYRSTRKSLETAQKVAADLKARFAKLSPPDKKVSGLPSACSEGQSGGLLAGLLNSATGTNSFTGVCDDKEKQKDSKGGPSAGRDHDDRGHAEHDD